MPPKPPCELFISARSNRWQLVSEAGDLRRNPIGSIPCPIRISHSTAATFSAPAPLALRSLWRPLPRLLTDRQSRSHALPRVGHLPKHALGRHGLGQRRYRRLPGGALQPRDSRQPCRGMAAEQGEEAAAARVVAKLAKRFQHRQIGLARAELFETLATGDAQVLVGDASQKRIDQGRLAATRPTGHEDQLPLAAQCLVQPTLELEQLGLAPHQSEFLWRAGSGRGPSTCCLGLWWIDDGGFGNEPIAATVHRLDETGFLRLVPQCFADLVDADFQRGIGHEGVGPDGLEQFLLGDQPAGVLQQISQDGEGFRGECDRLHTAPQAGVVRVEPEGIGEALSAEVPFVLVLEDLHWSDYSTLDLLSALARRRQPARLLVLATYRPVDVILGGHPLKAVKQELDVHRHCAELPLAFLTEAAVAGYLALRFPGSPLPPALPRLVHQRTEGHPLFVVNVVDYLVARSVLAPKAGSGPTWEVRDGWDAIAVEVPEGIWPMIDKQIDRLNPQEQRLLEGASVAGVEFSAAAAAAALEEDAVRAEALCEGLARRHLFLQTAGVSEWPDGTVAARYRFRHELYHNVIYQRTGAANRRQLHQRIGARLETAHGEPAGEIAVELAMHFEQAGDYGRAVRYLQQAAENAGRVFAYQEAAGLARRGVELLARLPDSSERARQELLLQLTLGQAYIASKGYAALETEQSFSRARELAKRLDEPQLVFVSTFGLACYNVVSEHLFEARTCSEELLQIASGLNDPMLLMGPHFALGITLECLGEFGAAHSHFEQAARLHNLQQHAAYRAIYSLDPGVYAYCDSGRALTVLGNSDQGRRRLEDAMALARRTGDPLTIAHTFHVAVYPHAFLSDYQKAHDLSDAGVAYCDEHGIALYRVWLAGTLGFARVHLGDADGLAVLREAIAGLRAARAEFGFSLYLGMLAEALFKLGRMDEAFAVVAEAFDVVRNKGDRLYEAELYRLRGEMLLAGHEGSQEEALASFREARAVARRQSATLFELPAAMSLSRLLHKQGKTAEARRTLIETYDWFTEGFDTPILRKAKSLLEELS